MVKQHLKESTKSKNLDEMLKEKGYFVISAVEQDKLPEELSLLSIQLARREFGVAQVIHSDIAYEGEGYQLEPSKYIIYATKGSNYRKYHKPKEVTIVIEHTLNKETGDVNIKKL